MSEKPQRIVLVGHCGPDAGMLRSAIRRMAPHAVIQAADDQETLRAAARDADLLLINRALDGSFDTGNGVQLIRDLAPTASAVLMLVSNFPDAQAAAEAAGAAPGFGKSAIGSEETARRLGYALALARSRGTGHVPE